MKKTEKDDSYSHILKYTGVFGGVQGLNILVGIVRNKLVAMILGPEGMGLMSLFNSTIKLFSDSTNLGIPMSAVREISEAYEHEDDTLMRHVVKLVRMWSLLTALTGMLLCMIFSPLLNRWTFAWGDHTLHFIALAPVVAIGAVTGGELAILKGTRQLAHLAALSIYGVVGATVSTVPMYYFWGISAVVPSLLVIALIQMLLTIAYSYRLFPLQTLAGSRQMIHDGLGMVRVGISFVMAGILGSGAEFLIRSYLNTTADLGVVGLYNAGYMMTMTYAGLVFSAMETDYFPRLSSIRGVGMELNQCVNHQIEVSLLLVSPLLVFFMIGLPVLLPFFYSGKFLPVAGMMRFAILAMYLRAIVLPIEYLTLAKGHSRAYLFLEAVYDVLIVLLVVAGYHWLSLTGTGLAILLAGIINLVVVLLVAHYKYQYRLSHLVRRYALIQLPLGVAAYLATVWLYGWSYWLVGSLLALASMAVTLQILHSKTHLWASLKKYFIRKIKS